MQEPLHQPRTTRLFARDLSFRAFWKTWTSRLLILTGRNPGLAEVGQLPYSRQTFPYRIMEGLSVTREEPAPRQRLRQVESGELWRSKSRIWVDERVGDSMPHHSQLASFVVGAFCIGHLYAQGLWPWEGSSTHSTRFVGSKQGDFRGESVDSVLLPSRRNFGGT
jgi:hypothetical protein